MEGKTIGLIAGIIGGVAALVTTTYFGINHGKEYIKEPEYYVYSTTMYSAGVDADWAYAQNRKEFNVGENCYMKYKVKIQSSNLKGDGEEIGVTVTIPKVNNVQAILLDGNDIDPEPDPINNVQRYYFKIVAYKDLSDKPDFGCVFQFIPNSTGYIDVTFDYDSPIKTSFDYKSSIQFIENRGGGE